MLGVLALTFTLGLQAPKVPVKRRTRDAFVELLAMVVLWMACAWLLTGKLVSIDF